MNLRQGFAGAASGILLLILLSGDDPGRLRRRGEIFFRSAGLDSKTRRLNGTASGFDRQFFVFLESARRSLPAGASGVAILGVPPSNAPLYLATYHLAPVPVLVAPERVPEGWLLAVYGPERPPGWTVLAPLWKGVLMSPAS